MIGYKKSRVREAILEALQGTQSHPPADRVWEEVKKVHPSVTLATVYRNLHILEQQGKVLSLDVGQGEKRYDGAVHQHAHFVCRRCRGVYDCDITMKSLFKEVRVPGEVEGFQVTLFGICEHCRKQRGLGSREGGEDKRKEKGR
ncbi:MAG: transcriptional repressor [Brevinematales bacterium]|nr:transcriptional repressor [Brevinematales bacterium]